MTIASESSIHTSLQQNTATDGFALEQSVRQQHHHQQQQQQTLKRLNEKHLPDRSVAAPCRNTRQTDNACKSYNISIVNNRLADDAHRRDCSGRQHSSCCNCHIVNDDVRRLVPLPPPPLHVVLFVLLGFVAHPLPSVTSCSICSNCEINK